MSFGWLSGPDLQHLPSYLTALAIGLLIGLERERNPTAKAGLRTCALVALAGAMSAALAQALAAPSIVAVGLGAVALMMIVAYYHHHEPSHERDPGTTTIVAVIACFLLGAMTVIGHTRPAVALAILITALLYFKAELGGAARRLERRDLVSILQFAVVAFVVLPLLPDRGFGPAGALNPRQVWLMVVLISGVSLAGYVALRVAGPTHGPALLGLLGGLVSSTATTVAYSRQARASAELTPLAASVIVTANLVLLLRLAVLAAFAAPALLVTLAPVLGGGLAVGASVFAFSSRRPAAAAALDVPPLSNPVELRAALGFAALYAAVLVAVAWLQPLTGAAGTYAIALASGLVDVDAISLSALRMSAVGALSPLQVAGTIVAAVLANAAFKLGVARAAGSAALARRCLPAMAGAAAGVLAGLALVWTTYPAEVRHAMAV